MDSSSLYDPGPVDDLGHLWISSNHPVRKIFLDSFQAVNGMS